VLHALWRTYTARRRNEDDGDGGGIRSPIGAGFSRIDTFLTVGTRVR